MREKARDDLDQLRVLTDCLRQGLHKMAVKLVPRFPYGIWACRDGREVLFDRAYKPIWQCRGGVVEVADRSEWVDHVAQEILFDDRPPYYQQYRSMKQLRSIVLRWEWLGRRSRRCA